MGAFVKAQGPGEGADGYMRFMDLSRALGVTATRLKKYLLRPGFPAKTARGYDVAACRAWLAESRRTKEDRMGPGNNGPGDLTILQSARREKLMREIALADLQIKKLRGQLLDAEEVEQAMMVLAAQFAAALDSIAMRCGHEVKRYPAAVAALEKAVAGVRAELAAWCADATHTLGLRPGARAAAGPDHLGVGGADAGVSKKVPDGAAG